MIRGCSLRCPIGIKRSGLRFGSQTSRSVRHTLGKQIVEGWSRGTHWQMRCFRMHEFADSPGRVETDQREGGSDCGRGVIGGDGNLCSSNRAGTCGIDWDAVCKNGADGGGALKLRGLCECSSMARPAVSHRIRGGVGVDAISAVAALVVARDVLVPGAADSGVYMDLLAGCYGKAVLLDVIDPRRSQGINA